MGKGGKMYSGLGDRHQQIVDGAITNYTLDLNAGLTQVLADGTNAYLYGNGRIAQADSTTEYFLGDALGSVRQLADTTGVVMLTQSYSPYGEVTQSVGTSQTSYAFTGENLDANGLTYLRARYYNSGDGRFISRDTWNGDYNRPLSLNRWNYVEGNPVNLVDPTGKNPWWCAYSDNPTECVNVWMERCQNEKLQDAFENFKKLPIYSEEDMIYHSYGITAVRYNPDEYGMFRNEDGSIDRAKLLKYGLLSQSAISQAISYFPNDYLPNGKVWGDGRANAFQHAYWSALLTKEFGKEFAKEITTHHEKNFDAERLTQFMDLYNNAVGIRIATENPNISSHALAEKIRDAILNGEMVVLIRDKKERYNAFFSDTCPTPSCLGY